MGVILRKYLVFMILLPALLVGAILAGCSSGCKLPRLAPDAVILAFGDSLTFGTGANPEESYPAVLEKMIGRRVVNAGIPGEVSGEGLLRLPALLEQEKPALLLLCHGGNDLLRRLDRQQSVRHLQEMIKLARRNGVAVVLIAVPAPGIIVSPSPIYLEIAKELSVPLEEKTLSAVLSDSSLKADYIHPNAAGYRHLAEALMALLKKNCALD